MIGYLLLAMALLITAGGQVLFKHYHVAKATSSLILAVMSFVIVVPITFVCVRLLGLATVYVFMSINYGLVALAGTFFFGESMTRTQLAGIALVIAGCIIYNL